MDNAGGLARRLAVHRDDIAQNEVAVLVARVADRALHDVARTERVAADLLLRDEDVLRAGEEVRLRAAQEAVAFLLDLQASRRRDGAAAREIVADGREDDLVALHRAEVLGVRVRHHALDDRPVVPAVDVLQPVLGQIGIARHAGRRRLVARLLVLVTRVQRTAVTLRVRRTTVEAVVGVVAGETAVAVAHARRAVRKALLAAQLALGERLLRALRAGGGGGRGGDGRDGARPSRRGSGRSRRRRLGLRVRR